jgi:hypothetical protein
MLSTFPQIELIAEISISTVDPSSGNPVVAGIASTYKGYAIGHCCAASKGEWEALSEAQKNLATQQFLR